MVKVTNERPPDVDGIEWQFTTCPGCGNTWWLGRDLDADFDLPAAAWVDLLGRCVDCRELVDRPNRAARRAARQRARR